MKPSMLTKWMVGAVASLGAVAYGLYRFFHRREPSASDPKIDELIAESGVRREGKSIRRRFEGFDGELQRKAARGRIQRLQSALDAQTPSVSQPGDSRVTPIRKAQSGR